MSSIRTQARGELSRLNVIRLLALGILLIFPATASAQQNPPIAEQVAKVYGLDLFGQVEAIRYTWNAGPMAKLSRKWEWSPKTDTVSYEGQDKEGKPVKVSYQRSQLVWPKRCHQERNRSRHSPTISIGCCSRSTSYGTAQTVTDEGMQKLPLGDGSAERVVVKYASEGGYQPGDTWELYRWRRQANRGDRLPPRRCQPAAPRDGNVCGL